jgi:hypothetical protein
MANGVQDNRVTIVAWPDRPVTANVSLHSTLTVKEVIPVCLQICQPICARSDYQVGITIFDRPVATISVTGETRLFNCDERK